MAPFARLLAGLRGLTARAEAEQELDEELRQYLETCVEAKVRAGMPRADAVRASRAEIGSLEAVKDAVRDVGWESRADSLWRDVHNALRTLRASPGFAAVAILTLSLSIGANTAVFSVVNGLLLRPLPVKDPGALDVLVNARGLSGANADVWERFREQASLFDGMLAWSSTQFNLGAAGTAEWVDGIAASGSFFETLGVPAARGRALTDADDRPGGGPDGPVVVISDSLWRTRFGSSTDAIGSRLAINRVPFTVVGVAPPWFFGPAVGRSFDVIVPLGAYPLLVSEHGIANNWLSIMVRRKAGQTFDQASAALELAQARMRADGSGISGAAPVLSLRSAQTGYSLVPGQYTRLLLTVMAVVAIVLLIACSNLANLLLARASARRRELGARLALGASRGRLVQQLLTESVVVTAIGAAGGLVVAWWGSRLLVRQLSSEASLTTGRIMFGSANLFLDLSVDWRVLLFTMAVTGAAALLFGLAPALQASGVAPMDVLKSDGTTPRGARRTRSGLAGWLIVSQVALSLVLVVAAGLLLRTFSALATVRLGYEPEDVLVVDLLSAGTPVDASTSLQTYDRILNRVRALAGVRHASMSNVPPFNGIGIGVQTADGDPWVAGALVSPGWFDTFGTRLLAGRDFTPNDRAGAPRVAIVNQAFAKAFLPDGFPMGRRISLATANGSPPAVEIVGLAEDIASSSLREPPPPAVFVPLAQVDEGFGADILQIALEEQGLSLSVRSRGESSGSLRASVADAVAAIDPRLTLTFRSPAREVEALLTEERVMAMLSAFFGVLALLLAAVGLYGVTSYAVSRRRAEMGVRVALGANQASIVRLILARSLALTSAGIVVGVIGAAAMTRYLQVLLWGLSPHDPATFIGVPVLFLLVSAIAAVVPAVRAGKVDPLVSLR